MLFESLMQPIKIISTPFQRLCTNEKPEERDFHHFLWDFFAITTDISPNKFSTTPNGGGIAGRPRRHEL